MRPILQILSAAGLASALAIQAGSALATGDASADLGVGGTARGDISTVDGETDTVTVDLVAGEPFDVKFKASFTAGLDLRDPAGDPVDIGYSPDARSYRSEGLVASQTGAYSFVITAAGDGQGVWKLQVKPAWPKKIAVGPFGQATLDIPVLADSVVSGTFKAGPGATVNLPGLFDPQGGRLTDPVVGTGRTARLPATSCISTGIHTLDVGASAGEVTGTINVKLPALQLANANLSNGLATVSFENDGVAQIFRQECASCHSWAAGYVGVRGYAAQSLGLMRVGSMPKGGRVTNEQIKLVEAWIRTGRQR
ncbi:MAG: hypothetical protein HMLKMBBP_02957 [Planctomycetes bacterium]|nr:hypothetical protein [Planctomycetota bacterium]